MAARFFINGGVNNNWSSTTNWSTTSGGGGGSSVPGAADDVTFDGNSPNCTVDVGSARNCLNLVITSGYVNTITLNSTLRVAGTTCTLGANMQQMQGNGTLRLDITGTTLTSNGKSIPNLTSISSGITLTLADPCVVQNEFTYNTVATLTLNGSTITIYGYLFVGATGLVAGKPTVQGTTVINLQNYNGSYTVLGTLSNTLNIIKPTRGY